MTPAASVAMPGLNARTEAETAALRCDDPSLPLGWEAALLPTFLCKVQSRACFSYQSDEELQLLQESAALQGGTSPAASGKMDVQTRTDAELVPRGPAEQCGVTALTLSLPPRRCLSVCLLQDSDCVWNQIHNRLWFRFPADGQKNET